MTTVRPLVPSADLRTVLGPEGAATLDEMAATLRATPASIDRLFPAAARRTARGPLAGTAHRIEDAVRVELVGAVASVRGPADLAEELRLLYRYGDADEKRAVLLALGGIDDVAVDARDLLLDALRTNDVRLVAAAMGPHARRLSAHDWRHGVLKCIFTGVPLAEVADLDTRADDELRAMVRRFADEREAAGRPVPDDAAALLTPRAETTTAPEKA
ncbi:EboA domain-containing protein [Nocardioides litoris]|uniref:EboA domain-containing protein n=1 Tax=Nocardioides litoris TaxID=1926648 RepID=UPI001B866881|nr:EboA domain-containing protein [Nocardioides litoris]